MILEIKNISIKDKLDQLISMDEFKDSLLAHVAHDLRTPLSSILYLIEESYESFDLDTIKNNL